MMYRIDQQYNAMLEALVGAIDDQKREPWMAVMAWHFSKHGIHGSSDYFQQLAACLTADLPEGGPRDSIIDELLTKEKALVDTPAAELPEMPENVLALLAQWSEAEEIDLDALKVEAKQRINRAAEAYRMNFITPGSGQSMAYQEKLAEARAFTNDPEIEESLVPHLSAEAAAESKTVADKAAEVLATYAGWATISAAIEGKRAAAKIAVDSAETAESIRAAANVDWAA